MEGASTGPLRQGRVSSMSPAHTDMAWGGEWFLVVEGALLQLRRGTPCRRWAGHRRTPQPAAGSVALPSSTSETHLATEEGERHPWILLPQHLPYSFPWLLLCILSENHQLP